MSEQETRRPRERAERRSSGRTRRRRTERKERAERPRRSLRKIRRKGARPEEPDGCMRIIGWLLVAGAALAIGNAVLGRFDGGWRAAVLWIGLGVPLLLGGLALNGWALRLFVVMAWMLPATFVLAGLILLLDPAYGETLDGARNWMSSLGKARTFGAIFASVGAAGLYGYAHTIRKGSKRR